MTKIIRKAYILNIAKTMIRGFHHVTVEECFLGCCAMWLNISFQSSEETYCLHPQGYESIQRLITLKVFKHQEAITQPTGVTTQKTCFLHTKQVCN
jgi:hypothetical protein